jgi:hypothetical protein
MDPPLLIGRCRHVGHRGVWECARPVGGGRGPAGGHPNFPDLACAGTQARVLRRTKRSSEQSASNAHRDQGHLVVIGSLVTVLQVKAGRFNPEIPFGTRRAYASAPGISSDIAAATGDIGAARGLRVAALR